MHSSQRRTYCCVVSPVLLAIMLAGSTPALPQAPVPQQAAIPSESQRLLPRLHSGLTLDRYLDSLRGDFFQLDADADGKITQLDVDLHTLMESVVLRNTALNFVMRFDLDGDGAVTEGEVRRTLKYDMRMQLGLAAFGAAGKSPTPVPQASERMIAETVALIMALDADKDGKVSSSEAGKFVLPGFREIGQNGQSARARQALASDFSASGEVMLAAYQAAGETLFRKIDSDGDGKISQQEVPDYRRQSGTPDRVARTAAVEAAQKRLLEEGDAARKKQEKQQQKEEVEAARAGCALPAPSPRAKVILLSVYETEALSSVAIGSQEVEVHAGRIMVEPGEEPLYVLIPTYAAMIWQFSGAVERIERLAMSSLVTGANRVDKAELPLVGATGIAKERISFFAKASCLGHFSEMPSIDSARALAAVRQITGQEPFKVVTAYSVSGFSIPSGKIESLADVPRKKLIAERAAGPGHPVDDPSNIVLHAPFTRALDDLYRFSPGGLVGIDPASVVASVPARTYEVFPQHAGLVQLLQLGALRQNGAEPYTFLMKTRIPVGLNGGMFTRFLVPRGVPVPDGDLVHSCVIVEDQTPRRVC